MWSLFVKCLFVTGNYFFACAHFRRRNWLDPHHTLLQILCAEEALLHADSSGARIIYIEEDQALHFEMSHFCLEVHMINISMQVCNINIETLWT